MYAQFDSTQPSPQPVIGWHAGDTPAMLAVPAADILQLTQAQWDARETTPFANNGALVAAPVQTAAQLLQAAQAAQIALLTKSYTVAIQSPVAYMATTFQADSDSQDVLTKSLAAGSVPAGFCWLDINNVFVPMTFAQAQGLAYAMLVQGDAAFVHLRTQKNAVMAATTVAAVQSIIF